MLTAGVFINAATGTVALRLAYAGNAAPQVQGFLALFGAFSLVSAAMNLVPFRIQDNYFRWCPDLPNFVASSVG
jgi:hypothetical protein